MWDDCSNNKTSHLASLSTSEQDVERDVELTSQCQRYQKEAVTTTIGSGTTAVVAATGVDNSSEELGDGIWRRRSDEAFCNDGGNVFNLIFFKFNYVHLPMDPPSTIVWSPYRRIIPSPKISCVITERNSCRYFFRLRFVAKSVDKLYLPTIFNPSILIDR